MCQVILMIFAIHLILLTSKVVPPGGQRAYYRALSVIMEPLAEVPDMSLISYFVQLQVPAIAFF